MAKVKYPRLAELMASQGMSRKDLAQLIGKAPSAVTEKLEGKTDFKWAEVKVITNFFKQHDSTVTSDIIFCDVVNYSNQESA